MAICVLFKCQSLHFWPLLLDLWELCSKFLCILNIFQKFLTIFPKPTLASIMYSNSLKQHKLLNLTVWIHQINYYYSPILRDYLFDLFVMYRTSIWYTQICKLVFLFILETAGIMLNSFTPSFYFGIIPASLSPNILWSCCEMY